jgi:hypothetical protein
MAPREAAEPPRKRPKLGTADMRKAHKLASATDIRRALQSTSVDALVESRP